jgi:hypothetical protein
MASKPSVPCGPAPPEAVYTDLSTLFTAIQAHARDNGYAFRVRSSKPHRVLYDCDRAGSYDSKGKKATVHPSKQRNSGSKKCGCEMRVVASKDAISGSWTLQVLNATHNHSASTAPVAHSAHRIAALDESIRDRIISVWKSGASNTQILSDLNTSFPNVHLTLSDIKNITQSIRLQQLGGKTPIQWLL